MIRLCFLVCFFGSSGIAQPVPRMGERVDSYLDLWDAWVETIPETERAQPLIDKVDAAMAEALETANGERYWASSPPADDGDASDKADWKWTAAFIDAHPEVLEMIREYSALPAVGASLRDSSFEHWSNPRPTYVMQISPKPNTLDDIAPLYWSSMRQHHVLLKVDAYLAIEHGNDERLLSDIQAIHGLARLSRVMGSWTDELISEAYASSLAGLIADPDIDWSGIRAETMLGLLEVSEKMQQLVLPTEALAIEHAIAQEKIDWFAEDAEHDRFGPLGMARLIDLKNRSLYAFLPASIAQTRGERIVVALAAITLQQSFASIPEHRQRIRAYFQEAIELSTSPGFSLRALPETVHQIDARQEQQQPIFAIADDAIRARNLPFMLYLHPTRISAARLRLCMEIHHRRHGHYPARIEDLDPDLQRFDLTDQFSGKPLRCKLVNAKLIIYSVGPNRDDDNGSPLLDDEGDQTLLPDFIPLNDLETMSKEEREANVGDWVLYPAAN